MAILGYNGKILRVNLSRGAISVDTPDENFYRRYIGGRGIISYYLLKELKPGIDPLGSDSKLIFAGGVLTGVPIAGSGRNSVGAKSPLTGCYGDAEVGGYFGAELRHAGFDAVIIEGKSNNPVYLWINDGKAEIKDAAHLWGKTTGDVQDFIQQELGDKGIRVAQTGIAGENLVRYACIMNDLTHAAGRCGLGAVMGSKKLRAVAVRGHGKVPVSSEETVSALAKKLAEFLKTEKFAISMNDLGTPGMLMALQTSGGLPTRNFQTSAFEGAENISGEKMKETILVGRGGCFACPVRCKRELEVAFDQPYHVEAKYGGPEYETLAALGSNCGIDNLKAVAFGNQLCASYGMDTISTGSAISFAMECFENGLISEKDTGGIQLKFGNVEAMVQMVEMIARRQGLGNTLAEGVARSAAKFGQKAKDYAMEVKGQELPMHEPRFKPGLGVGYALSPTGADHCHNVHDHLNSRRVATDLKAMGVLEPVPTQELSPAKVRMLIYGSFWEHTLDCLVQCRFVHNSPGDLAELVRGITGWNATYYELAKVGERAINLTRVFNIREGKTAADDYIPRRFFTPVPTGPLKGVAVKEEEFKKAVATYYEMLGWDKEGKPSPAKLQELGIGWAAEGA